MFFGGIVYIGWYEARVLDKVSDFWLDLIAVITDSLFQIEEAFPAGYEPALELYIRARCQEDFYWPLDAEAVPWGHWDAIPRLRRQDQDQIDRILHGEDVGYYFLLLGPKVSLRMSMV